MKPDPVPASLPAGHVAGLPLTALAPMQDVTDLAFMSVVSHYGAPDFFFTEFFRVHAQSHPVYALLYNVDPVTPPRPDLRAYVVDDGSRSFLELFGKT